MATATKKPVKKNIKTVAKKEIIKPVKKAAPKSIIKRVTSFETACKELKISSRALPIVTGLPEIHRRAIIANYKLFVIAQALNEGWVPDYNNSDEYKYYPWFWKGKAGFAFAIASCGWSGTYARAGSRLVFKTDALAEYFGKAFIKLHNEYLLM